MTVIPFTLEGSERSVVEKEEEFGRDGKAVLIDPLNKDQLVSPKEANVCYDLRVGREYRDHRESVKRDLLNDTDEIILHPGSAVIIETEEYVRFPKSIFGHIVPKVSLLQQGISNTSSKVDPGYFGPLLITVFNLGKKTIPLRRKQPICSLYLMEVRGTSRPYDKGTKRIQGEGSRTWWTRLRDFIERNTAFIVVILMLLTLLNILIQLADRFIPFLSESNKVSTTSDR